MSRELWDRPKGVVSWFFMHPWMCVGDHMAVEIMCTCQLTKTPAVNLRLSSDYAERTSVLDEKAFFSNETIMVTGDGELAILNIRIDHEPDERGRIANIEGGLCQQGRKFQSWIETGGKRPKRCKAWYPDAHDDQQDFATAECGPCGQYQAGPITAIGEKYPDLGIGCDAIACPLL
uniref:Uncharacterized protein n=1 Tax=Lotharella globosa TaxID=91324 RepID=A0A7S3YP34_9EUKA